MTTLMGLMCTSDSYIRIIDVMFVDADNVVLVLSAQLAVINKLLDFMSKLFHLFPYFN